MHLLDAHGRFVNDCQAIELKQEITKDFLDGLHSDRLASAHIERDERHKVAEVPTMVVDLWIRQGFDFWNATAKEVVARLKAEDLHAFLATERSV